MKKAEDIVLSDTFDLVKEWQSLERREKDLAFEKQQFCRKVRGRFAAGVSGDRNFKDWCIVNLKMNEQEASLMLTAAIAGAVFKNADEAKAAGGFTALSLLYDLDPSEQESVMRIAKSQEEKIGTIWRRRHANRTESRTPTLDARRLSEHYSKNDPSPPKHIREIMARYVRLERKRATA